jgi:hypothetical protein
MDSFDLDAYTARSRAVDLTGIDWEEIPRRALSPAAVRTLHYMQDIEIHTIVYLRELASTRAIDDPRVATFLTCWAYEETHHGLALERFLAAAGHPVTPRPLSRGTFGARLQALGIALVSRLWPDFVAVHMTWGAINELATLLSYQRLSALAGHPVLSELLTRIIRDESRHFGFYFDQARRRLQLPRVARLTRFLVEHFWAPVGNNVQPAAATRFVAAYLFGGVDGRAAARHADATIRSLPGFADVPLLEAWIDRCADGGGHDRRRGAPPWLGEALAVRQLAAHEPSSEVRSP